MAPDAAEPTPDHRAGSDACYKCSVCDTTCPVAAVDDTFPGPKFQGPEQWRLGRPDEMDIDPSIMSCSNCMRCDQACPTGVPLAQMHNDARAMYVTHAMSWYSREYLRNRILANYGALSQIASHFPRIANIGLDVFGPMLSRLLKLTPHRELPRFAHEPFTTWWEARGGDAGSLERAREQRAARGLDHDADKRVAYFHGDYANVNTPAVAKALVNVFEWFGYAVAVPTQRCSGTPMLANGMRADASRAAEVNVRELASLVEDGYDIVCSCTSCSMTLRHDYPALFDFPDTEAVAAATSDAIEYLRVNESLETVLSEAALDIGTLGYHAPCHARNQGIAGQPVELFANVDGIDVHDLGPTCSGMSGTYGWKAEKYDISMAIGQSMFEHMARLDARGGLTECPTCAMQMEHGSTYDVQHPLEVIEEALCDSSETGRSFSQ